MSYQITDPSLWTGRESTTTAYLYQLISCRSMEYLETEDAPKFSLLGYGVDQGVQRNSGRVGAAQGPKEFRTFLSGLSNPFKKVQPIGDYGTLYCDEDRLEEVQESLSECVYNLLKAGSFPIVIGGGHDMAYGHFKGIQKFIHQPSKKIGIINLDAHLDLRLPTNGANSGTPFYQISQEVNSFHYLCIGYRESANNSELQTKATELGVQILDRKYCHISQTAYCLEQINAFVASVDYLYLTVDLDGFADAYAPGVSAASPLGFDVDFAFWCLDHLVQSPKLVSMDIAELNPTYDIDHRTAKLAAGIAHRVLKNRE